MSADTITIREDGPEPVEILVEPIAPTPLTPVTSTFGPEPVEEHIDAAVFVIGGSTTIVDTGTVTRTAGQNLSGRRVVRAGTDGRAYYADAADPSDAGRALGITTGAAVEDDDATIRWRGSMIESSWAWTPNAPIFVGSNGTLTQSPPAAPGQAFSQRVAYAVTTTEIVVDLAADAIILT